MNVFRTLALESPISITSGLQVTTKGLRAVSLPPSSTQRAIIIVVSPLSSVSLINKRITIRLFKEYNNVRHDTEFLLNSRTLWLLRLSTINLLS